MTARRREAPPHEAGHLRNGGALRTTVDVEQSRRGGSALRRRRQLDAVPAVTDPWVQAARRRR